MGMNSSWAAGLNGFLNGGVEGYKTGKTLQDMAAERALKKKEFQLQVEKASSGQTTIGPDGKVYQSEGISPDAKAGLLGTTSTPRTILPGATDVGTGKISLVKANTAPIIPINVPEATYNENPSLYQEAPAGHKYNIIKASKGPVDPAVADARLGMDEIRKKSLRGETLNDNESALVRQYAKTLGSNVTTEEDKGVIAWANKLLGDTQHNLVPGDVKGNKTKVLSKEVAAQYLAKANGDKAAARKLAKADGYKVGE